jgi:hypothetical protein
MFLIPLPLLIGLFISVACQSKFYALRTEFLLYIKAVSYTNRQSVTAETRIRSQVIPCEIHGEQGGSGAGFSSRTSVFFPTAEYYSSRFHVAGMTNGLSPGSLLNANAICLPCCVPL